MNEVGYSRRRSGLFLRFPETNLPKTAVVSNYCRDINPYFLRRNGII